MRIERKAGWRLGDSFALEAEVKKGYTNALVELMPGCKLLDDNRPFILLVSSP